MKSVFKRILQASIFLTIAMASATMSSNGHSNRVIYDLQCEYLINPIGLDAGSPRFTWKIADKSNGAKQSAYRILVGKDSLAVAKGSGEIWDSGKLVKDVNLESYGGKALEPFTKYFWKVLVWDKDGKEYRTKKAASFEMGMMDINNWKGSWIADTKDINLKPAPYFRKLVSVPKKIASARAYIAVGGLYELYINGKKIGNHRLDPVYTRFDKRNVYVTYDVTAQLKKGSNAIGVLLGNGWYNHQSLAVWNFDKAPWRNRPAFCLNLRITYEDGSTAIIASDQDWKTSLSPVILNSIYTAEHYDARLEQPGWNTVDFDDRQWKDVIIRKAPSANIVAQAMHPIRNVREIPAKSINKINDTTWVFDIGQNIAGVSEIEVNGENGTVIRLKHGERLHKDGRVDLSNIDVYYKPVDNQDPFQTDIFILKGRGKEQFMPRFNYKGFQYVEVTSNKPISLDKNSLKAHFMHSDVPVKGTLNSSSPLINKVWKATNNSYLSNLFGYPTDCPQREKNGWTGDGHFAIETALFNFDGITVYEKWIADHRDEQQQNGVLPDIIPTGGWGYGTANGTDWTSTIAIIPWNIYMFYGDNSLLKKTYPNIKKYVDYVESISPAGLTTFGRGDWVPVKSKSSLELTSSIYFYVDALILAKTAQMLNKSADFEYYTALAEKIKTAINKKYLNVETGIYATGTQTELSVPLQWGIVPEQLISKVAARLAERVEADGMHIDVGVLGAKAILNALSENGHPEIAYKLAAQDTYPSWGWWIANGATTLYENWDINAERDISFNHMMFGEIGAWLYKALGGIRPDERQPGFKHFFVEPHVVAALDHFETSFQSPYGEIYSAWKKKGDQVHFSIVVPPNATATFKHNKLRKELGAGGHKLVVSIKNTSI
ncbi:alpha-L-rhamnosidase [Pedobacter immunditicola]|uniref:alpha-L-rhamnosidase n=1 Tax=Pedobacter immunditicola TaxID=3133440 RepID=UPI00309B786D